MNLNLNQLSVFIYEFDENLIVKFTLRVTLLRSFFFKKKPSKKTSNIKKYDF